MTSNSEVAQSLWSICETTYFRLNLRIRSQHTKNQYRYALNNFAEFLGHTPTIADLSDDNIAGMMGRLLDEGLESQTVNSRRERIHALWTWLARRGAIGHWPTTPPLDEPERIVEAWTIAEMNRLVAGCRATPGKIGVVPASEWWIGWHALQWNTSERFGAMLAATRAMLRGTALYLPAKIRKGKRKDARYTLWPETLNALAAVYHWSHSEKLLPWPYHESTFWNQYGKLLEHAGLPNNRTCKTQKVRRSVATHIFANGGDATAALLHSSDAVTRKHYLDYSICRPQQQDVLPR